MDSASATGNAAIAGIRAVTDDATDAEAAPKHRVKDAAVAPSSSPAESAGRTHNNPSRKRVTDAESRVMAVASAMKAVNRARVVSNAKAAATRIVRRRTDRRAL